LVATPGESSARSAKRAANAIQPPLLARVGGKKKRGVWRAQRLGSCLRGAGASRAPADAGGRCAGWCQRVSESRTRGREESRSRGGGEEARWCQRVSESRRSRGGEDERSRGLEDSRLSKSPTREQRVAVGVCGCVWGEWVGGCVGVGVWVWVCGCVGVDVCVGACVRVCCLLCHAGND
jgi:hypothetical protein